MLLGTLQPPLNYFVFNIWFQRRAKLKEQLGLGDNWGVSGEYWARCRSFKLTTHASQWLWLLECCEEGHHEAGCAKSIDAFTHGCPADDEDEAKRAATEAAAGAGKSGIKPETTVYEQEDGLTTTVNIQPITMDSEEEREKEDRWAGEGGSDGLREELDRAVLHAAQRKGA